MHKKTCRSNKQENLSEKETLPEVNYVFLPQLIFHHGLCPHFCNNEGTSLKPNILQYVSFCSFFNLRFVFFFAFCKDNKKKITHLITYLKSSYYRNSVAILCEKCHFFLRRNALHHCEKTPCY